MPDPELVVKPVIRSIIIDWLDPQKRGLVQQTVVRLRRRSPEQAVADVMAFANNHLRDDLAILALSRLAEETRATPADERICRAYLSLSDFSFRSMLNNTSPSQRGKAGFPVKRENNPSPVARASASLNRIQLFISFRNAALWTCALFP